MRFTIICIALVLTSCGQSNNQGAQGTPGFTPVVHILPADPSICPAGGQQIDVTDENGNTSINTVCNGSSGTPGLGAQPGLACNVYSILPKDYASVVSFPTMMQDGTLQFKTIMSNFNVPNESDNNVFASFTPAQQALIGSTNYAIDCSGFINVPSYGFYTFNLASDDGSALFIDYQTQILMPVKQPYTASSVTLVLQQGLNPIEVLYFQGPATNIGLTLQWQGPANMGLGTLAPVPASAFTH